jgi:hypothetical protein
MPRTRARHAEICDALARGLTITEISRTLRLDRKTVRRYATAATPDQLVPDARVTRPRILGPHLHYLHQRWDEGCRSTEKLHEELRARGYRGSLRTLRRHTAQLRQDSAPAAPPPAPPAKKVASWILTPPAKLPDDHRTALAQITARCEELAITRALVREFADMLCHRHGEHLETWANQAETIPVSELRGFAKGLRKDWAAVTAGLTLPCSSGVVEGHVNRIKMIKRPMYGRPNPTCCASASCSPTDPSPQLSQSHLNMATCGYFSTATDSPAGRGSAPVGDHVVRRGDRAGLWPLVSGVHPAVAGAWSASRAIP